MLFPLAPPLARLLDQRLSLYFNLKNVIKVWNPKLIWLILRHLLDLMFVTIVVFLDTFVRIALSCILKSKCPNGHRFPLKDLQLFFGELLKNLNFLTQFQEKLNSFMSFSRNNKTRAFSSSRPKTRAVWVKKEPKT